MFEMQKAVKYDGLVVFVGMLVSIQVSTKTKTKTGMCQIPKEEPLKDIKLDIFTLSEL